jgi:hypothetical protein
MESALLIKSAAAVASGIIAAEYAKGQEFDQAKIAEIAKLSVRVVLAIDAARQVF